MIEDQLVLLLAFCAPMYVFGSRIWFVDLAIAPSIPTREDAFYHVLWNTVLVLLPEALWIFIFSTIRF
jgi:hypothetical protein